MNKKAEHYFNETHRLLITCLNDIKDLVGENKIYHDIIKQDLISILTYLENKPEEDLDTILLCSIQNLEKVVNVFISENVIGWSFNTEDFDYLRSAKDYETILMEACLSFRLYMHHKQYGN